MTGIEPKLKDSQLGVPAITPQQGWTEGQKMVVNRRGCPFFLEKGKRRRREEFLRVASVDVD